MMIRIILLLTLLTSLARAEDDHDHGSDEIVKLSAAEMAEFAIETSVAGPGLIATHLELPGEVQPNADRVAHIVPRYEGIVTEVRVHEGDMVKVGQILAIVESDAKIGRASCRERV